MAGLWEALGGSSRKFRHTKTGEILSRRQYDKAFGNLARQGFTSYEKKAAASPESLRMSRPAINRPSSRTVHDISGFSKVGPLTEKLGRNLVISFVVNFGEDQDLYENAAEYEGVYSQAIEALSKNKKLDFVQISVTPEGGAPNTIIRLTTKDSLPDFDAFIQTLQDKLEKSTTSWADSGTLINIIFHLSFNPKDIPKSKRKREIAESRRLKTKRTQKTRQRKARK